MFELRNLLLALRLADFAAGGVVPQIESRGGCEQAEEEQGASGFRHGSWTKERGGSFGFEPDLR